ncbi:hypothetical protein JT06_17700 [Desulfobulbus sp. Tol-SR]|nr:hypothetical protein JT06_17700 [Desulfobulbus sp. Tol-SR]
MQTHIGYVRVSSLDQRPDRQLHGLSLHKVFTDTATGRDIARPQLAACLDYLRQGDVLHVHSIDRLARNLQDLLGVVTSLTQKGVAVVFHAENLTFTGDPDPFQRLQLQIIGAVAEFERSLIRERQREGIARARARGAHLGRRPVLTPAQVEELAARAAAGATKAELAREFGVSRQTVYARLADKGRPA